MSDIKYVSFEDIQEEIIDNFRHRALLPVLGSGFSAGCSSREGVVPSGCESQEYMIDAIRKTKRYSDNDIAILEKRGFSRIHEIYVKLFNKEIRRSYLRNSFTNVKLGKDKINFLDIDWPYIYTLNLDDAIENSSRYKTVILPNHPVNDSVYDEDKCVVKLHGDAQTMITYDDAEAILSKSEYIKSLDKNQSLLGRIEHDMLYQNIIYIGCSLDDELDIQSVAVNINSESQTNKYFCTTLDHKPKGLALDDLRDYGITYVVVFDDFSSIYTSIYDLWQETKKIIPRDVDGFEISSYSQSKDMSYETNKSFFFFGKSLIGVDRKIVVPYYFIEREILNGIHKRMETVPVQVVIGNGYSGKTYLMIGLVRPYVNKKIYIFSSKDRVSQSALNLLLKQNGSVLLFDNKSLSLKQVETILLSRNSIKRNQIKIVIFADKSDNDLASYLTLMQQKGEIDKDEKILMIIENKLTGNDTKKLNVLLPKCELGVFNKSSILSNILRISEDLRISSLYYKNKPSLKSVREISAIIALATKRTLPELEAIRFNILAELDKQVRVAKPMLEKVPTWPFEKSASNNSQAKYVVNAERWLEACLQNFAYSDNSEMISSAYEYLISRVISVYGQPEFGYKSVSHYKEYILFDNINRLFFGGNRYGKQSIHLIKSIYDKLNELLATEPHYMHQKAKCYIRCSYYEKMDSDRLVYLRHAYRIVNTAKDIFYKRYEDTNNEKVFISYFHTRYTQAVVLCQICRCNNYADMRENIEALHIVCEAFSSEYNSYSYAERDSFNYGNAIYALLEKMLIEYKDVLSLEDIEQIQFLFNSFKFNRNSSAVSKII